MNADHIAYGEQWNNELNVMIEAIDAQEAEEMLHRKERFAVAGGPEPLDTDMNDPFDGDPADWAIYVDPQGDLVTYIVHFFNFWGTCLAEYTFREQPDGRLFVEQVDIWSYPDATQFWDYTDSTASEVMKFKSDGYSDRAVITRQPDGSNDVQFTQYTDTDVTANWEPKPAFGDWSGLTNRNRFN